MTDWTPPPPGDTREQLPDHLLELIDIPQYLSTACEGAMHLATALRLNPERAADLGEWRDRMHQRCRSNNKYTGQLCGCSCHPHADDAHGLDSEQRLAPDVESRRSP